MRPYRIYVDTSVIGGCLDDEFAHWSNRLLEQVLERKLLMLISDIVLGELEGAPPDVLSILRGVPADRMVRVPITAEVDALRDAYLAAKIVSRKSIDDAAHVAAATVARADAIVSWNFRHIVHLDKIKGYQNVNYQRGYGNLVILSPRDIIGDG